MKKIKKFIFRNRFLLKPIQFFLDIVYCRNKCVSKNNGSGIILKHIHGKKNTIFIGKGSILRKPEIRINGNNNKVLFGENCIIGEQCSFWVEGNNNTIKVGSNTTFTCNVHFCAQEENMCIDVGEDCMFSNHIILRTSDSHAIYNSFDFRINNPKSVNIGNHVWIAPDVKILKGANIGDASIIGSNSIVNCEIPSNCLAVGYPAKIVRKDIHWSREKLF